jgi:hypothetical protein
LSELEKQALAGDMPGFMEQYEKMTGGEPLNVKNLYPEKFSAKPYNPFTQLEQKGQRAVDRLGPGATTFQSSMGPVLKQASQSKTELNRGLWQNNPLATDAPKTFQALEFWGAPPEAQNPFLPPGNSVFNY